MIGSRVPVIRMYALGLGNDARRFKPLSQPLPSIFIELQTISYSDSSDGP